MYCQKCGTKNDDTSKFCCNCAAPLTDDTVVADTKKAKSKLFSAHILNIISAVVLILSIVFIVYAASHAVGEYSNTITNPDGSTSNSFSGTVTYDTSGAPIAYAICAADAVVVLIGFIVYFSKNLSAKRKLSLAYLIGACIMTCGLFVGGMETLVFTCGIGFVMIAAGILQIIAGAKFLSATKHD